MNVTWRRFAAILWSALLAFAILIVGQGAWSALLFLNFKKASSAPWAVPVMALVLFLMWKYLGGSGWPRSTSVKRRQLLRANAVSVRCMVLAFLAGSFAVVALAGYWIVFCQLVRTPPNLLPSTSGYPLITVVLVLAMSTLVSPIVEEMGFRGYCQQILEARFAPGTAIVISSCLFMLAHVNHGWLWPKLVPYFLAGLVFGSLAYLSNSILASIPVHIFGDAVFFIFVWPHDASRRLVSEGGATGWFWGHLVQAAAFTTLSLLAFKRLRQRTPHAEPRLAAKNSVVSQLL